MDGVLVCSLHRYKLQAEKQAIDLQHWIDNEPNHVFDTLLPTHEQYKQDLLNPETFVIIATARDLESHKQFDFIRDIVGQPNAVVSRLGRSDTRGGVQMKSEGILAVINAHGLNGVKDRHVYEDNASYLLGVCENIAAIPHFIPSLQGH